MKAISPKNRLQPQWLTPKQFAEEVQFNVRTILDYIKKGFIPALKLGRVYRIHRSVLEGFKPATNAE